MRLWELTLFGLLVAFLAVLIDPVMAGGWGAQAIIQFAKAGLANVFLYWVLRAILHRRTHVLTSWDLTIRETVLTLAHAIVTGAVLLAG